MSTSSRQLIGTEACPADPLRLHQRYSLAVAVRKAAGGISGESPPGCWGHHQHTTGTVSGAQQHSRAKAQMPRLHLLPPQASWAPLGTWKARGAGGTWHSQGRLQGAGYSLRIVPPARSRSQGREWISGRLELGRTARRRWSPPWRPLLQARRRAVVAGRTSTLLW